MAWAFQRDSELLQIFNYYLDKMQQTGVIDRLRQEFIGGHNRDTDVSVIQMQNINSLGYENVVVLFLALLTGLCVALFQLGIETATFCKKTDNEEQSIK